MLSKIVKSSKLLFSLALSYKEPAKKELHSLNEEETKLLKELEKNGVVAVPNFLSDEECELLKKEYHRLEKKHGKDFNSDRRIFGIECLNENYKKLFHDMEIGKKIGENYIGEELFLQTTMAARIEPNPNKNYGSGGSWHRDSFSRQFKAIAYLSDVEMENGPFMYIKGSHTLENIKKVLFELKRDTYPGNFRYTLDEIEQIKKILNEDITYFTAPKGTLLLADIRGLHTGMPIQKGERYSVFNYYIAKSYRIPNNNIEQLAKENCEKR